MRGFTAPSQFLTKRELQERLHLRSTRAVDELVRKRKIPVIRLGHRTVRFEWASVEAAIKKFTIQAVSE